MAVRGYGEGEVGEGEDHPALDDVGGVEMPVVEDQPRPAVSFARLNNLNSGQFGKTVSGKMFSGGRGIHGCHSVLTKVAASLAVRHQINSLL